ncbi:hypothetical protein VFPFJ_05818 [Purpureocillium lilacinum]|uniref:Uncharacterized protein n=1 Tax=Purpureocillium lilacinum TaxID=33203 RepID=A0A179HIW7_PURLI|nr:hypothetical protein VFPFJ_05818 [Purpureocillium lilacinum]OAQ89409.1 hypothetical protein VFPFJ_05818 [Purpureocillium lilacinum]
MPSIYVQERQQQWSNGLGGCFVLSKGSTLYSTGTVLYSSACTGALGGRKASPQGRLDGALGRQRGRATSAAVQARQSRARQGRTGQGRRYQWVGKNHPKLRPPRQA